MNLKKILRTAASADGGTTSPAPPTPAAPVALNSITAADHIANLCTALREGALITKTLMNDPHFKNCPFVASIRAGIENGAVARLQHLENWFNENPIENPAAPAKK